MSIAFGTCPHCPRDSRSVRLWNGACLHHFKNPPPPKDGREKVVKPTLEEVQAIAATVALKPTRAQLDAWYAERLKERPVFCQEPGCRHRLRHLTGLAARCTVAHVVPKRNFWSVALHPLNRLYLCKLPHHDDYDASWDKAQHLGCWQLAVDNFKTFMHLITDKELRFLPDALRQLTNR